MNEVQNYTAIVTRDRSVQELTFEASLREFGRSIVCYGSTPQAAVKEAYKEAAELIEELREEGKEIPAPDAPAEWESYSGKVTMRVPRSLHYRLHLLAQREGVSLNSLVNKLLLEGVEGKRSETAPLMPTRVVANYGSGDNTIHLNIEPGYRVGL